MNDRSTNTHHPQRIYATVNGASTRVPDGGRQFIGGWSETSDRPGAAEYVRADIFDSLMFHAGVMQAAFFLPDPDRRQFFIGDRLRKKRHINRKDICKAFGVSVPQASLDLNRYIAANPGALAYNTSTKRYELAAEVKTDG